MPTVTLCGFWPHATAAAAAQLGDAMLAPETLEPDQVRATWYADDPPHVVTVVPADLLLDGLTDETLLYAAGLHDDPADPRSIGDLVARQLEQADTVVLAGETEDGDAWEAEQLRVLLRRIAPWSRHCELAGLHVTGPGRDRPLDLPTRGLRGLPVGVHEPVPDHGVTACVFHARRPLHPVRLHDALDAITDGVLRSRGHFWLASRPDLVMTWESAGALSLGPVCGWLDALPAGQWATVDSERRLAADIDWDPYYGDRHHQLCFTGIDLDPVRLQRILTGCLLTDDELSRGEEHWRGLPDPFARACPAPAATTNTKDLP